MAGESFDMGRFTAVTDSIETLLGYLKGNELVDQWADEQLGPENLPHMADGDTEDGAPVDYTFKTWPADTQYAFPFARKRRTMVPAGRVHEWDAATKETYDNGASWAAGTASYMRSLVSDLTGADVAGMQATLESMKSAGDDIGGLIVAGWTSVELDDDDWWGGQARADFNTTITQFNDYLRDHYLAYWRIAEGTFGATAAVAARLQKDLLPYVEAIESGLKDQLNAWAASRGRPGDIKKLDEKVADALKLGYDLANLIPAVSEVTGKIETGVDIAGQFLALFGDEPPKVPDDYKEVDPDTIYIAATADLARGYGHGFHDALDALRSRSSNAVANQQANENWLMKNFTDLPDQDWTHALENN